jgi:hypothetical protein
MLDQVQQSEGHGGDHAQPMTITKYRGSGMCSILEPHRVAGWSTATLGSDVVWPVWALVAASRD